MTIELSKDEAYVMWDGMKPYTRQIYTQMMQHRGIFRTSTRKLALELHRSEATIQKGLTYLLNHHIIGRRIEYQVYLGHRVKVSWYWIKKRMPLA